MKTNVEEDQHAAPANDKCCGGSETTAQERANGGTMKTDKEDERKVALVYMWADRRAVLGHKIRYAQMCHERLQVSMLATCEQIERCAEEMDSARTQLNNLSGHHLYYPLSETTCDLREALPTLRKMIGDPIDKAAERFESLWWELVSPFVRLYSRYLQKPAAANMEMR